MATQYAGIVKSGIGGAVAEMVKPGALANFRQLFGLSIIPGTLNISLPEPLDLSLLRYVKFSDIGWGFDPATQGIDYQGEIGMYYHRANIAGRYPGFIIVFTWVADIYTHAELVSMVHLRTTLGLRDGDTIIFTLDETT